MNEIQERITQLDGVGWSLAAIADELGVPIMTLYGWQTGMRSAENSRSVLHMLDSLFKRRRYCVKCGGQLEASDVSCNECAQPICQCFTYKSSESILLDKVDCTNCHGVRTILASIPASHLVEDRNLLKKTLAWLLMASGLWLAQEQWSAYEPDDGLVGISVISILLGGFWTSKLSRRLFIERLGRKVTGMFRKTPFPHLPDLISDVQPRGTARWLIWPLAPLLFVIGWLSLGLMGTGLFLFVVLLWLMELVLTPVYLVIGVYRRVNNRRR